MSSLQNASTTLRHLWNEPGTVTNAQRGSTACLYWTAQRLPLASGELRPFLCGVGEELTSPPKAAVTFPNISRQPVGVTCHLYSIHPAPSQGCAC